ASAHSAGEILSESGAWTLAFDLADPRRAGAYQGVSQAGPAIGGMLAPVVVTTTAIRYGAPGWAMLAAGVLAPPPAAPPPPRRARDARPHPARGPRHTGPRDGSVRAVVRGDGGERGLRLPAHIGIGNTVTVLVDLHDAVAGQVQVVARVAIGAVLMTVQGEEK